MPQSDVKCEQVEMPESSEDPLPTHVTVATPSQEANGSSAECSDSTAGMSVESEAVVPAKCCENGECDKYELPENWQWLKKNIKGLLRAEGNFVQIDRLRGKVVETVTRAERKSGGSAEGISHFKKMSVNTLSCFLCKLSSYFKVVGDTVYIKAGERHARPLYIMKTWHVDDINDVDAEEENESKFFTCDYDVSTPAFDKPVHVITSVSKASGTILQLLDTATKGNVKEIRDLPNYFATSQHAKRRRPEHVPPTEKDESDWDKSDDDEEEKSEADGELGAGDEDRRSWQDEDEGEEQPATPFYLPVFALAAKTEVGPHDDKEKGVEMPHHKLCLIQVASMNRDVYLFDVLSNPKILAPECDGGSGLREFLESPFIVKVMHDCAVTTAVLFYEKAIVMKNVFDCQVADRLLESQFASESKSVCDEGEGSDWGDSSSCAITPFPALDLVDLTNKYQVCLDMKNMKLDTDCRVQMCFNNKKARNERSKGRRNECCTDSCDKRAEFIKQGRKWKSKGEKRGGDRFVCADERDGGRGCSGNGGGSGGGDDGGNGGGDDGRCGGGEGGVSVDDDGEGEGFCSRGKGFGPNRQKSECDGDHYQNVGEKSDIPNNADRRQNRCQALWRCRPLVDKYIIRAANDVLALVPKMYCMMKNAMKKNKRYFRKLCREAVCNNITEEGLLAMEASPWRDDLIQIIEDKLSKWVHLDKLHSSACDGGYEDENYEQDEDWEAGLASLAPSGTTTTTNVPHTNTHHTLAHAVTATASRKVSVLVQTDIVGDIITRHLDIEADVRCAGGGCSQTRLSGDVITIKQVQTSISGHIYTEEVDHTVGEEPCGQSQTYCTGQVLFV